MYPASRMRPLTAHKRVCHCTESAPSPHLQAAHRRLSRRDRHFSMPAPVHRCSRCATGIARWCTVIAHPCAKTKPVPGISRWCTASINAGQVATLMPQIYYKWHWHCTQVQPYTPIIGIRRQCPDKHLRRTPVHFLSVLATASI